MPQYRIQFTSPVLSYNGGDVAYFTADVAAKLVALGHTALDALPVGTPVPPGSLSDQTITTPPATIADATNIQAEAGVLP